MRIETAERLNGDDPVHPEDKFELHGCCVVELDAELSFRLNSSREPSALAESLYQSAVEQSSSKVDKLLHII